MLNKYYLNKLSGNSYDAYYAIDGAVRSYRPECMLYGISAAEAEALIKAYNYDNPDVWHCALQFVRATEESRGVRLSFIYNDFDTAKFDEALRKITDRIDSHTTAYSSDYDIARIAYDILCEEVRADHDTIGCFASLDKSDAAALEEFVREHGAVFTAYGAIVNKSAVCMGVAAAYKLILDRYRVEAACAAGVYDNTPHMVNVLLLDGERSYVDVTKGMREENFNMTRYDFFLVGDERIKIYFEPEEEFGCVLSTRNFFVQNKLYFRRGSELRRYLNSFSFKRVSGEVRFFYAGMGFDDDMLEKMIGDIVCARCGTEYEVVGYVAENGVGNCLMRKREG